MNGPMYQPCAYRMRAKNSSNRTAVPTHLYVTYGVDWSNSAWYCLCSFDVCADIEAKGVWSGSGASIFTRRDGQEIVGKTEADVRLQQAEIRARLLGSQEGVEVSSQGKWSSMGRAGQVARLVGSAKWRWRCDDFEICLELELTKRLPKAPKGHPTSRLVFLIGPHFFIALIDRSLRRPLSRAVIPAVSVPRGAERPERIGCTEVPNLEYAFTCAPIRPPTLGASQSLVGTGNTEKASCDDTAPVLVTHPRPTATIGLRCPRASVHALLGAWLQLESNCLPVPYHFCTGLLASGHSSTRPLSYTASRLAGDVPSQLQPPPATI